MTTTNDSGAGSLRQAIIDANALAGPDTITFAPGVTGTIALAADLPYIVGGLTILGPGEAALTVVSPPQPNGFVFLTTGAVSPPAISISDLSIAADPGQAATACGIGFTNVDVTLTRFTASSFGCTGIQVLDGSLTATDVTVDDCGAGLSFRGNDATDELELTNIHAVGTLLGVSAVVAGATARVTSVDADDAGIFGIYLATSAGGSLTASGLRADRAGTTGIIIASSDSGSTLAVSDASADDSAGQGLNLEATSGGTITATDVTATRSGSSGLWLSASNSGSLTVADSTVQGTVSNSGIWVDRVDDASLTISGTRVLDNTSDFGGGIYFRGVTDGATVNVTGASVTGNTSTDDGGGIHVSRLADNDTTLTIGDSIVSGNTASDFGGGISLMNVGDTAATTGRVVIQRTTIDDNSSLFGYGGGLAVVDPSSGTEALPAVLVDSSTLSHNTTTVGGGGMYVTKFGGADAVVKVLNSTLSSNLAQLAGGLHVEMGAGGGVLTTIVSGATVLGNVAHETGGIETGGGGQTSTLQVENSIIAGSTSDIVGGTANDLRLGAPYSLTYSLVQTPDTGVAVPASAGNITGVAPRLGPLANNGGTTLTHLIGPDSPAYNAGDPAFLGAGLLDQRGQARVLARLDMGAVESQDAPALPRTGLAAPEPEPPLIALLLVLSGIAMVAFSRLRLARSVN